MIQSVTWAIVFGKLIFPRLVSKLIVKAACILIGPRIRNHFQSKSIIDFLKETHKVQALYHNGALVEDNLIYSFDTEYLTGMHYIIYPRST